MAKKPSKKGLPVNTRLPPAEFDHLNQISDREDQSRANMARMLLILAMQEYDKVRSWAFLKEMSVAKK